MSQKNLPYIFLLLLIIVLIFLGGVKYGQKVEETNKVIKYVLSVTPTKPAPTQIPEKPLEYKTFIDQYICGVKFLYPNTLTPVEDRDGRTRGILSLRDQDGMEHVYLQCFWPNISDEPIRVAFDKTLQLPSSITASATFKDKPIVIYQGQNNEISLKFWHPKIQNTYFLVSLNKNLYPLFEKTLEFIPLEKDLRLSPPVLK